MQSVLLNILLQISRRLFCRYISAVLIYKILKQDNYRYKILFAFYEFIRFNQTIKVHLTEYDTNSIEWWMFWHPDSGAIGGVIMGLVLSPIVIYIISNL